MAICTNNLLDSSSLYCEEQQWFEEEEYPEDDDPESERTQNPPLFPLQNHDLIGEEEDEELNSLFSKETETFYPIQDPNLFLINRREAVNWVIKVNAHYGFSALTAILAVNYFDRFFSRFDLENEAKKRKKPWMVQLVAVTCLSLAAKVEETHVPLLLDFQVEGAKYVFESKTIQRMELLVLSTLEWRMNPLTPLSFIHHIMRRRLGFKTHFHLVFLRQCESLLLTLIADWRFVGYKASVLATATMLCVISYKVEELRCNHIDYQNQLLDVLNLCWEKVNDCYLLVMELSNTHNNDPQQNKRKHEHISTSPSDISNAFLSSRDDSNDSHASINPSSISSSSSEPPFKRKSRASEQCSRMRSLTGIFVDVLGSPQ